MSEPATQIELCLDDSLPGLVDYSVRVSVRARHVNLRVLPVSGLEITIPRWFRRRDIPELIRDNRDWIEKQLAHVRANTNPEFLIWPPEELHLRSHSGVAQLTSQPRNTLHQEYRQCDITSDVLACGLCVKVNYLRKAEASSLSGRLRNDQLELTGNTTDRALLLRLFSRILKQEARKVFLPQVEGYAREFGMSYQKVVIRGQRTLWGSYSSSGTLSLNFKLLFLPPELSRYVLLHELAHTRFLDHSARFWRCLSTMEPKARELDNELGERAGDFVPPWLERVS